MVQQSGNAAGPVRNTVVGLLLITHQPFQHPYITGRRVPGFLPDSTIRADNSLLLSSPVWHAPHAGPVGGRCESPPFI